MVVGAATFYSPIHVFAAFAIILVILATFRHPPNGLYLIILAIPFDSHFVDLGLISLSASNALIITTLVAWLFAHFNAKSHIVQDGNYALIAMMILGALASTLVAIDAQAHLRSIITLIGCGLTYFLAVNLITNTKILTRVLWSLGISLAMAAAIAIIQAVGFRYWGLSLGIGRVFEFIGQGQPLLLPRVTSTWLDPNAFGFFLLTGLPALLYFAVRSRSHKVSYLALISVISFGLFLSYSRGAWVGLAASLAILFFLLLRERSSKKTWPLILVGTASMAIALGILLRNIIMVPVSFIIDLNPVAVEARLDFFEASLEDFFVNPILGLGFDGFLARHGWYIHNTYLETLLSLGVLGFLPFFILIARTTVLSLKSRDDTIAAMAACLVGLLVASSFISALFLKNLWLLLGAIIAAAKIYEKERLQR